MKAIITGAGGTVGRALTQVLHNEGGTPIAWKRDETPIDNYHAMEAFILAHKPDALFHLAIPSQATGRPDDSERVYHWTGELAWLCHLHNIPFVYTSTVMVYTDDAVGPFTPDTPPDATSGYGADKRRTEERVLAQNPAARIARLGWQIGDAPGTNNMLDFLERQTRETGAVQASERWLPSCSFVADTAQALIALAGMAGGIYLVNSNPQWSFYAIAHALSEQQGRRWPIVPTQDFVYDQRMLDARVPIASLAARLPGLG